MKEPWCEVQSDQIFGLRKEEVKSSIDSIMEGSFCVLPLNLYVAFILLSVIETNANPPAFIAK
jgi:hypothetical protein